MIQHLDGRVFAPDPDHKNAAQARCDGCRDQTDEDSNQGWFTTQTPKVVQTPGGNHARRGTKQRARD